jgi:CBS-domain-containing membrane protein
MRVATKPFANLTAADLMSRDVTVIPRHLSLRTAAHLLSQARVSGAPVIDASGACVGVISSTDFVHWAEGRQPVRRDTLCAECVCSDWQVFDAESLPIEEVGSYMTPDPVTAGANTPIGELARMMLDAHIHRVIIVDHANHPEGIVSSTDILAAVAASRYGA